MSIKTLSIAAVAALSIAACGTAEVDTQVAANTPDSVATTTSEPKMSPEDVSNALRIQQDPATLPGVSTTVGDRSDDYGTTTVPVTVTNDSDAIVSVWVTVRAENKKTVFGDGYLAVENLKPGQSYTEDVYFGDADVIAPNATFTVIEVEKY